MREAAARRAEPVAEQPDPSVAATARCPAGMQLMFKGSESYCIDLYEYPNAPGTAPSVRVTWQDAVDLCKFGDKRLCSAAEWEQACRGQENRLFGYGAAFDGSACNTADGAHVVPSGSFKKCASGKAFDLVGNVAEWTASADTESAAARVTKGGSVGDGALATCESSTSVAPNATKDALGLRCCADAL